MKFKVKKLQTAIADIEKLDKEQQELLKLDYSIIENKGIEFVYVKHIHKKIYEIKTKEIRSLFAYQPEKIILIGVVFIKKTQKTPKELIRLAHKRLKEA